MANENLRKKKRVKAFPSETIKAALTATYGLIKPAAESLGCSAQTIRNRLRDDPDLLQHRNQCREDSLDVAESALMGAVESGEAWAVCFYLKTQGKERGYVERQEIHATHYAGMTDEELKSSIAADIKALGIGSDDKP